MTRGPDNGRKVSVPGNGFARAAAGRIRLLLSDPTYTVWSPLSTPVQFSVPDGLFRSNVALPAGADTAAATAPQACAVLRPFDSISASLLTSPTSRRPDPFGGKEVANQNFLGSATSHNLWPHYIGTYDSWLFPYDGTLSLNPKGGYNQAAVYQYLQDTGLTPHAAFASQPSYHDLHGDVASFMGRMRQAVTGDLSCDDPATSGVQCVGNGSLCTDTVACLRAQVADATQQSFKYHYCLSATDCNPAYTPPDPSNATYVAWVEANIKPPLVMGYPAIRLQAVDATGRGVPGLRVRMNVFDVSYPNLPSLAEVITCGLVVCPDGPGSAGCDAQELTVEGLLASEVSEMWSERQGQNACITNADGVVEMRIKHPLAREWGPILNEFISSAYSGTISFEYAAYQPVTDKTGAVTSLSRACSESYDLQISSRARAVEWGTRLDGSAEPRLTDPEEQQRTAFAIFSDAGALVESLPSPTDIMGNNSVYPLDTPEGVQTVTLAAVIEPTIMTSATNAFCFRVSDTDGGGLANKMLSYDFVHLPSYLPGWSTALAPSCFSAPQCDVQLGSLGIPPEQGGNATLRINEYGFSAASSSLLNRLLVYPFEPFATFTTLQTGTADISKPGVGCVATNIHEGHPGVYGVVLAVDGIRSSPLLFNVKSKLAVIEVETQPLNFIEQVVTPPPPPPDAPAGRRLHASEEETNISVGRRLADRAAAAGRSLSEAGGDVAWRLKNRLKQPPVAKLLDAQGQPLPHYQVFVRAVDPDTHQPLEDVLFELTDGHGTILEGIYHPVGSARSFPADAQGLAPFPYLNLFDASNGTRFKLQIYFRVTAYVPTSPRSRPISRHLV